MILPASRLLTLQIAACVCAAACAMSARAGETPPEAVANALRQYCWDCHTGSDAQGQADLERAVSIPFAEGFKTWRKVIAALEQGKMPPATAEQPSKQQRQELIAVLRRQLEQAIQAHADDPGPVVLRRLTSAEYGYTVADLTGVDLDLGRDFVSDAVGGEGFTNVGTAQFMEEATLERYLEAAKQVAAHAVIGAGPLDFFRDPGQTGLELSAIHRILQIYRQHGFRTAAGEGGQPYGLDRYPKAFYVAWRYAHRAALGQPNATLETLAAAEGIDARFARYIVSVLSHEDALFPTSEILASWRQLPTPRSGQSGVEEQARRQCQALYEQLQAWQRLMAGPVTRKEEAAVLSERSLAVDTKHAFEVDVYWPTGATQAQVRFAVASAEPRRDRRTLVVWKNARLRFRTPGQRPAEPQPLRHFAQDGQLDTLQLGRHPAGADMGADDFVIAGADARTITLPIPSGATRAELWVDVELDRRHGEDGVVRCSVAEGEEALQGEAISAILADPDGEALRHWRRGVEEFARLLPQISHREPAPSDRDPIPAPFDNSYNMPERDHFHYKLKYYRDDRFLVEHVLDDAARAKLDQAWADLLGSFEYHDIYLRFVASKYGLSLGEGGMAQLDPRQIEQMPPEPRQHVRRLYDEYQWVQRLQSAGEPGHLDDVLHFAARAWRRPLEAAERDELKEFYRRLRQDALSHEQAIRALVARLLAAPQFLYRLERPATGSEPAELSDWELASRLSYFLWSSLPDEPLRQAAASGSLRDPEQLVAHARRMLKDPKSRRLATEFFGQWFGFYQFDRFRGIDPERFPEFNEALKAAMYEEAVALFAHIVQHNRPIEEILFADYTFLNHDLAAHYGLNTVDLGKPLVRVQNVDRQHRGGLLGLGAVLAVTSAPLRTSPVKRGDWVLRRVLGSPVPPPPADAGSIPADDVLADGKTVRQRLEAHRNNAACMNCHVRIDPLGFALENYDPLGRWRTEYRDAEPIDASGTLADGTLLDGPQALRQYLRSRRQEFYRTLCTRLAGYALGRAESIADQALIDRMLQSCRDGKAGMAELVATIVVSPQFRTIRSADEPLASVTPPRAERRPVENGTQDQGSEDGQP